MDFIYRAVSRSMPENIGHILHDILYVWPHWTVHRSTQRVSPPCGLLWLSRSWLSLLCRLPDCRCPHWVLQ